MLSWWAVQLFTNKKSKNRICRIFPKLGNCSCKFCLFSARKTDSLDDDDDLPNTYDYKDSFIDDIQESDESDESDPDPEPSDSDFDPENSEDIRRLVKDAKGFMKNKKVMNWDLCCYCGVLV